MRFTPLTLAGAFLVEPEPIADARGFFARTWCEREFAERGLDARLTQCNLSYNASKGTLRGMHWQAEPHAEAKLVRCVRGAVYDVIVDLRPGSPSFRRWQAIELDAERRGAVYVPAGFAHGFQTLVDHSELFYQMSTAYHPASARGARWDDPALAITWPLPSPLVSARDAGYPDLVPPVAADRGRP